MLTSMPNSEVSFTETSPPATGALPAAEFPRRPTASTNTAQSSGSPAAGVTARRFLKLVRSGNNFSAYHSADRRDVDADRRR